jgi:hypothetical protein
VSAQHRSTSCSAAHTVVEGRDVDVADANMSRAVADRRLSSAFSTPPPPHRRLLRPHPTPIVSRSLSPSVLARQTTDIDVEESAGK